MSSRQSRYQAKKVADLADIGSIPPIADPERREFAGKDLLGFLTVYFPETTGMSVFSQEQKNAIERIESAILNGGSRVLNLFPRGFAKTTISQNATLWAVLYGHRSFVPIIGADENAARVNIQSIKTELESNFLLAEDFPEVHTALAHLEGKYQRCASQTYQGELTRIEWNQSKIVLPSVRLDDGWTPASGAIIAACGLTGRIRGMVHKRPDGKNQRPDFVIIDDPQTGRSAVSPSQCNKRLSLIRKDIMRLGGHKTKIAAVMNATVIEEDDVVDQLADHVRHPEWEGLRIPMLKSDSKRHDDLWMDRYAEIRKTYNPEDPKDRRRALEDSNRFYLENREAMDDGAEATWHVCYSDDEHSAIQHAYNIRIDDGEDVFASECQNKPIRIGASAEIMPVGQMLNSRVGTWEAFPDDVVSIGWHIDVQKRLLYWTAVGITEDFRIHPVYGCYPEQKKMHFEYRNLKKSIQQVHRGMSEERSVQMALEELITQLSTKRWQLQGGEELTADAGLVDGGYMAPSVRKAIDNVGDTNVRILFGRGVRAADVPLLQRKKSKREIRSTDGAIPWVMKQDESDKRRRNVFNDTNAAKTFLHRRIITEAGRPGSFELPQGEHRRYCEHLASSEYPTETSGPFGTVMEWRQLPGNPDNHWFDTTCGAIVAASIGGKVAFSRQREVQKRKPRKRVQYL